MNSADFSASALIDIAPDLVWLRTDDTGAQTAVFHSASGAIKTRTLSDIEHRLLECIDGSRSKTDIAHMLGMSLAQCDDIFRDLITWAPDAISLRMADPKMAAKRDKTIAAAIELRDIWAAMNATKDDNDTFHKTGISAAHEQFDSVETTISHAYRAPSDALKNRTYGEAFCDWLLEQGWITPNARIIEVGCGLGYFAEALLTTLSQRRRDLYDTISLTLFDLSPDLAESQKTVCAEHLGKIRFLHGNIETYDFAHEKFDLVISNEVIADLSVAPINVADVHNNKATSDATGLAIKYDLDLPKSITGPNQTSVINFGAIRFLETLGKCLSETGKAILTEYGTLDRVPKAVHLQNHLEFLVQFGHLKTVSDKLGFQTNIQTLGEMLDFDKAFQPLDTPSFHVLSKGVLPLLDCAPIPHLAYSREALESLIGPRINQVSNLRFLPLSDPHAFTPFRFFALSLER
ncbi:SAM-dependent methyltransferase [Planktotalea sp.]|uniref:SAM-dependent methyltransferase n=1 Tax=Planktotalea sp. TaxID=2029877 RepID=UPI003D6B7B61